MRGLSGGHALALKNRESRQRRAKEEMMRERGLLDIKKAKKRRSEASIMDQNGKLFNSSQKNNSN